MCSGGLQGQTARHEAGRADQRATQRSDRRHSGAVGPHIISLKLKIPG